MKIELWIDESEGGLREIYNELLETYDRDLETNSRILLINEDKKFKIEEGYIESDGSIYITAYSKGGISYSISIPFEEWFSECIRFKSTETLLKFIKTHKNEISEIEQYLKNNKR